MNTNHTDHDTEVVIPELEKLTEGSDHDQAALFDLALKKGASLELLKDIAVSYLTRRHDEYEVVALPYVGKLLDAGYPTTTAAALVSHLCLIDEGYGTEAHIAGFWADSKAQNVFEDVESLKRFLMALADVSPTGVIRHLEQIQEMFAVRRTPLDRRGYRPGINLSLGEDDTTRVLSRAAAHLEYIHSDDVLDLLLKRVTVSSRIMAAKRVNISRQGLTLIGAVMSTFALTHEDEQQLFHKVYGEIKHRMESGNYAEAIMVYRWLLEGVKRQTGRDNYEFHKGLMHLRSQMEYHGFRILTVTSREKKNRAGFDLQVELSERGKRIVVKHLERGERHEHVHEGDEVILHPSMLSQPVFAKGNLSIYVTELFPLTPPAFLHKDAIRRSPGRSLI